MLASLSSGGARNKYEEGPKSTMNFFPTNTKKKYNRYYINMRESQIKLIFSPITNRKMNKKIIRKVEGEEKKRKSL